MLITMIVVLWLKRKLARVKPCVSVKAPSSLFGSRVALKALLWVMAKVSLVIPIKVDLDCHRLPNLVNPVVNNNLAVNNLVRMVNLAISPVVNNPVSLAAPMINKISLKGLVFFEDLIVGDGVEVFGDRNETTSEIDALGVKILREFDDGEFGFPVAIGRIQGLDRENKTFEIEEAPGLLTLVVIDDNTEFFIQTFDFGPGDPGQGGGPNDFGDPNGFGDPNNQGGPGQGSFGLAARFAQVVQGQPGGQQPGGQQPGDPNGQPGGDFNQPPPQEPATFDDLEEDDDVEYLW